MSKIKDEEYYLWRSIVPDLEKNVQQCLKDFRDKYIRINPPNNFELSKMRISEKCKHQGNIDFQDDQLEVFAFTIEQRTNISLMQLGQQFKASFGKDNDFWTLKITEWANMMKLTSNLTIWNVNSFMQNFVNYQQGPMSRDLIYQWRSKTQAYLASLEFIIKKINKLEKNSPAYVLDEAYVKYHKEKVLYTAFNAKLGLGSFDDSKNSYNEEATMTFYNKSKAEKKLFNFPTVKKNQNGSNNVTKLKNSRLNPRKSGNTLERYNFIKNMNVVEQVYLPNDQQKREIEHEKFVNALKNIGRQELESLHDLRLKLIYEKQDDELKAKQKEQGNELEISMKSTKRNNSFENEQFHTLLISQIQSLQNPNFIKLPLNHFTHIHDPEDYFFYQGFPIAKREGLIMNDPFFFYPWVNYQMNDEEEYDELMAVSLDGSSVGGSSSSEQDQSEDDDIEHDQNFIDFREGFLYDQNQDYTKLAPEDRINFAQTIIDPQKRKRWVADSKSYQGDDILANFPILPIHGDKLPYEMEATYDNKSKRRNQFSKNKTNQNQNNSTKYEIQKIDQNLEEDNDTTNKLLRPNQKKIQVRINFIQTKKQSENTDKKIESHFEDEETTFEQKVQQKPAPFSSKKLSNTFSTSKNKSKRKVKDRSTVYDNNSSEYDANNQKCNQSPIQRLNSSSPVNNQYVAQKMQIQVNPFDNRKNPQLNSQEKFPMPQDQIITSDKNQDKVQKDFEI